MTNTCTLRSQHVVLGERASLRVGPATIHIENGRISAVHEGASDTPVDEDLGDAIIAPAFINAHTHLSMVGFRGLMSAGELRGNVVEDLFFRLERSMTPQDTLAFTRLGALESLAHGVGRVWDHYYFAEAVASALREVGLRGVVAPTLQDLSGPGVAQLEAQLAATVELSEGAWADAGIHAAFGPHATDTVSADLWQRVSALATRHDLPVHAHVAQSVEEYQRAQQRHGCSPIAWLERLGVLEAARLLAVHAIFVSHEDLERLDRTRHVLGYCPLSQQQFCFPAHVPSWQGAGIDWCVGTDCAVSNDSMNVQRELVAVAGIRGFAPSSSEAYATFRSDPSEAHALAADRRRIEAIDAAGELADPKTLLASVWSVPGRMHPAFTAGVIEVGAEADFALFDPEHPALWPCSDVLRALALCDVGRALDGLMLGGSWRIPRGRVHAFLQTPEVREARAEARARLTALKSRF